MPQSIPRKVFRHLVKKLRKLVIPTKVNRNKEAFTFCIIEVNILKTGWQKTVAKVLRTFIYLRYHTIDGDGVMELSGTADPEVLLETIGKKGNRLKLRWVQFGVCSSFLHGPSRKDIPPPRLKQ